MTNPILKAHLEGVEMFKEKFDICNNPDHDFIDAIGGEIGRLGCPVCGGKFDNPKLFVPSEILSFLTTYAEMILNAVKEAGPEELKDSVKNDILFTEAEWFNKCRLSYCSAINEGIKEIKKT